MSLVENYNTIKNLIEIYSASLVNAVDEHQDIIADYMCEAKLAITYNEDLTEMQDDEFYDQPFFVELRKVMVEETQIWGL